MRILLFILCPLGSGVSSPVLANEDNCNPAKELNAYDSGAQCRCGKGVAKLKINPPRGLSLVAACDYKEVNQHDVLGGFYFQGGATVSGTVKREDSMIFGDYLSFEADEKFPDDQFRSAFTRMRFHDNVTAFRLFRTPKVSAKSACWSAHVTMRVTVLYVLTDYGTDYEGSYAEKYQVLKIGNYTPCKPSD